MYNIFTCLIILVYDKHNDVNYCLCQFQTFSNFVLDYYFHKCINFLCVSSTVLYYAHLTPYGIVLRECGSCVPLLVLFCGYVDNFQSCGLIQCHSVEYMLLMLKFALKDIINVSFKNFSCITKNAWF